MTHGSSVGLVTPLMKIGEMDHPQVLSNLDLQQVSHLRLRSMDTVFSLCHWPKRS